MLREIQHTSDAAYSVKHFVVAGRRQPHCSKLSTGVGSRVEEWSVPSFMFGKLEYPLIAKDCHIVGMP